MWKKYNFWIGLCFVVYGILQLGYGFLFSGAIYGIHFILFIIGFLLLFISTLISSIDYKRNKTL